MLVQRQSNCAVTVNATQTKAWALLKLCFSWLILALGISFMGSSPALAKALFPVFAPAPVTPPPVTPRSFDMVGLLEEASLDVDNVEGTCGKKAADNRLDGGTAKINGISITIPCNTVVQMPATSLTWADLFRNNPSGMGIGAKPETGLALKDTPIPGHSLPSYEFHIQGNIVDGKYIAGLVFISQQLANVGQGTIERIDYDLAELTIKTAKTGEIIRVRINDPVGRFGKVHSNTTGTNVVTETEFDPRFTADVDNPTIRTVTGFPMCIPRSNPFDANQGDDPLCPETNRPRSPDCRNLPATLAGRVGFPAFNLPTAGQYCRQFVMKALNCTGTSCDATDPTRQAPFEIGDYVNYSGTLKTEFDPVTQQPLYSYISAHTIIANLGIYTAPGTAPAYAAIEESLVGTNALPIANLPQETTSLVKVIGFTTDPTNLVDIFMVDVNPITGIASDRRIGTENPGLPPVIGRFKFQPAAGNYGPFSRELRIVSRSACRTPTAKCADALPTHANGIQAGQYRAPNFDFIFPEVVQTGDPVVPNNFQDLYFLYCGSGAFSPAPFDQTASSSVLVGSLDPAPWASPMPSPAFTCPTPPIVALTASAPFVDAGTNRSVNGGTVVTLSGIARDPQGLPLKSAVWSLVNKPANATVTLAPATTTVVSGVAAKFTAPPTSGAYTFALTATGANGVTSSSNVTIYVNQDIVTITSAVYNNRNNKGTLKVVARSSLPATTAGLQLSVQANYGSFSLSSAPIPMSVVANTTSVVTCPTGANPCFQFEATGVIKNTWSGGFLPPDSITVTSNRGGKATITSPSILIQ